MTEHPDQAPAQPVPHSVWRNPWHFLAFGFGSGTLPKAPGTWGSLVALPFVPLWRMLPDWGYWLMLGVTMLFGFWLCGKVADDLRVHDHEGIVWDEMVGMWITLWLVPEGWWWLLVGFVVFRIVDIAKPWPISWIDRNVHGGVGIMLDDVLAGVFAWLVMQGLTWGWAHWLIWGRAMRRLLCLLLCLCWLPALSTPSALAAETPAGLPAEIRVVSEVWSNYSQADGRGLAWDLLRAIYEPAGVRLSLRSEPYVRSVGLVQRGEADAWVGSYRNEIDHVIYPHWPYDVDPIGALGLKTSPVPKLSTLGYRLAWMRGYAFERYLEVKQRNELQRRSSALPMLDGHRIDYFIDARPELEEMIAATGVDASAYRITDVGSIPLYLGFANNDRGRALAKLYDSRMQALYRSGELERLFARWHWPYAPLKQLLPPKE